MSDLLKVTTPLTGQESMSKVKPNLNPNEQTNITNVVNPDKVTKTDNQNVYPDRQNAEQFIKNANSNFDKFMQILKNMPNLTDVFRETYFSKLGTLVNSGVSEDFTQEIAKFMDLLKTDEAGLLNLMKSQTNAASKFNGPFFDVLRQIFKGNSSPEVKSAILDFLKTYDNATSSKHILNNMIANLKSIASSMPAKYGEGLMSLINQLEGESNAVFKSGAEARDPKAEVNNINMLKGQIVPFLSNYVSHTRDFGAARSFISLFVLNLVRYESATTGNFSNAFSNFIGYEQIAETLKGVDLGKLERALLNSNAKPENAELLESFVKMISHGLKGDAGVANKEVFENMLNSLLLNKSVYMPVLHIMLPADVNGQLFFSEIWIDPNDQSGGNGKDREDGNSTKMLIKFDIKDVGFFEMIILNKDSKVDLQLYYPKNLKSFEKDIKENIESIMSKNNLNLNMVLVEGLSAPKSISEVFPKIYERKNAINVTI